MRLYMKILLPILVILAGGAAFGILAGARNQPKTRPPIRELPSIRTAAIKAGSLRMSIRSQGTIRPRTESTLVPQVSGVITWVSDSWASGGFFARDEILLKIDPSDYELALAKAEAAVAQAELRLAREEQEASVARKEWESLLRLDPTMKRKASPLLLRDPQVAEARAALNAARAGLTKAQLDISRTGIRAAFAGRIRDTFADVGQFVNQGTPVAKVYSVDFAEVRLPINDSDLRFIDLPLAYRNDGAPGNQPMPEVLLYARFGGREQEPWKGRIVRTEGAIDPQSRMIHAVAQVPDPYGRSNRQRPPLAVGLFVKADISGKTFQNIATLPRKAVSEDGRVLLIEKTGEDQHRLVSRKAAVLRLEGSEAIIDLAGSEVAGGDLICISTVEVFVEGMSITLDDARETE
ncbi:MAG TPA: efflux transporter periplasmic adaptor subunit [Planctomycetes bacterium]|jgi:RND family efflux transporter MFP subunit|nr:efflux transporter periplasmic adaptor subunit [Planctomycetota bacterium]